jgi:hypothetical protein
MASAPILASGQKQVGVPTCTAAAPSMKAAATPRPSAMPPAAITGYLHRVDDLRHQRHGADLSRRRRRRGTCRDGRRLRHLRDDRVAAFGLEPARLRDVVAEDRILAPLARTRRATPARAAEMEADDRRPQLHDAIADRGVERLRCGRVRQSPPDPRRTPRSA